MSRYAMRLLTGAIVVALVACTTMMAGAAEGQKPERRPKVQLAVLLDTSNSMDGLIDQAKTQLWKVVSEFVELKLAGRTPTLEVALYEYGNDKLPAKEGYLRMVKPLTTDLDGVSEALFALTTDGGEEYCGKVIQVAAAQLKWSSQKGDLKCVFIAGNEPFNQGNVDYQTACKAAADKGITISTIFCGDRDQGINTKWEHGAKLADGSYLCINQDHATRSIPTPHDDKLAQLSGELNKTYLAYGDARSQREFANRQKAQDANAVRSAVGVAAARAGFKASSLYKNSGWDLVDAVGDGTLKLNELKPEQLPEIMRSMSPSERQAHLSKTAQQRKQIQAQIRKLTTVRDQFVTKELTRLAAEAPEEAEAAAAPLADAIMQAVEAQVEK